MSGAASAIRVIGSRFSPDSGRLWEFLARNRIPHEWLDPDADSDVERPLREFDIAPRDLPVVIATGSVLRRPTLAFWPITSG
jgi:thioredoxin reductase (NADPH)